MTLWFERVRVRAGEKSRRVISKIAIPVYVFFAIVDIIAYYRFGSLSPERIPIFAREDLHFLQIS